MKKTLLVIVLCCGDAQLGYASTGTIGITWGFALNQIPEMESSAKGFNIKYSYGWSDSDFGLVSSFSHTKDHNDDVLCHNDKCLSMEGKYFSYSTGVSYKVTDSMKVYGLIGAANMEKTVNDQRYRKNSSVIYGGGIQLIPDQNRLLDLSVDTTRLFGKQIATYTIGGGILF